MIELRAKYDELKQSTDVHAQSYREKYISLGNYSDPAGEYAEKCIKLERSIKYFEQKVNPVKILKRELQDVQYIGKNGILYKILIKVFFWHMKPDDFCTEFKFARRTFYRRKNELVRIAMKYFE